MVILNRCQKPKTAKADEHDCQSILKALDAKRVPVGDKVKYWLDNNIVGNEQELNSQATDDNRDSFVRDSFVTNNDEEIGGVHDQQSHSNEYPLPELAGTMDAGSDDDGNIATLQNLKAVFLAAKEKRKRSPSSPLTADHIPRLSKRRQQETVEERKDVSVERRGRQNLRGPQDGTSGEESGIDREREMVVDQRSTAKTVVSKAQRIGGGVKQKDRQQEMVKQLQVQLTVEQRQTENLAKQHEELVSQQDQLQSQLHKERTQNERMKEKYLILRQQVQEMSKSKTAFKCLGCDSINTHMTVTSRNALQFLSRDSGTCRYHRHLTEFVKKRMPLITITASPTVAVHQPSFDQLPQEQLQPSFDQLPLQPSHDDEKQQPYLEQGDQQVLQDPAELSTNSSPMQSSSSQDEQLSSIASQEKQPISKQPSPSQEDHHPLIQELSSPSQDQEEEQSLIQSSPIQKQHSQFHNRQDLPRHIQPLQLTSCPPHQSMTQQHKAHQHESQSRPKQNHTHQPHQPHQPMTKQYKIHQRHYQPKQPQQNRQKK